MKVRHTPSKKKIRHRAAYTGIEKEYVETPSKLIKEAEALSKWDRVSLLATIRTGEPLTEYQRLLRWTILRQMTITAYQSRYKRKYYITTWCLMDNGVYSYYNSQLSSLYEMEVERVTTLHYFLKRYGIKKYSKWHSSPPIKSILTATKLPEGEWYKEQQAILAGLKSYYINFLGLELNLSLSRKGVSLSAIQSYKLKYPPNHRKPAEHRTLVAFFILRENNLDVGKSLKAWADSQEDYPTPSQVLTMYVTLLRTEAIIRFANPEYYNRFDELDNESFEEAVEDEQRIFGEDWFYPEKLKNIKRAGHAIQKIRELRHDIKSIWGKPE